MIRNNSLYIPTMADISTSMLHPLSPIEEKLLTIPGVSPLTYEDEQMLRDSFSKKSIQYAHSFLYFLRASHGKHGSLGYKFISKEIKTIIGYRNNIIYITPICDTTQGEKLAIFCDKIFQKTGSCILLKKFSKRKYPKLHFADSIKLTADELEDDTCPETVLNLPTLFVTPEGAINRKAKRFFRKVKRFKKLNLHFDIIEDLTQIPIENVIKFLKEDDGKSESFLPIVTYLYSHGQDDRYETTIFLHKGIVQGLYIIEKFSPKEVGLYTAVTTKNQPGITEWMDHHVFQEMFFEGIQKIYFGGAENEGIDYYIKKLLPERTKYFVQTVAYKNK